MLHSDSLRELLESYQPEDARDAEVQNRCLHLLMSEPGCFYRNCFPAHFTASLWIIGQNFSMALLLLHSKLGKWVQVGGHADGNKNLLEVALREALEETGLQKIVLRDSQIFDLDIHVIPATPEEPAHFHYDVRFLGVTDSETPLKANHESLNLKWLPFDQIERYTTEISIQRMCRKALKRIDSTRTNWESQYSYDKPLLSRA